MAWGSAACCGCSATPATCLPKLLSIIGISALFCCVLIFSSPLSELGRRWRQLLLGSTPGARGALGARGKLGARMPEPGHTGSRNAGGGVTVAARGASDGTGVVVSERECDLGRLDGLGSNGGTGGGNCNGGTGARISF